VKWELTVECKKHFLMVFVSVLLFSLISGAGFPAPVRARVRTGATIYVDAGNSGDPLEDGSPNHPFNMIQEGVDAAGTGDAVKVAAGVYYEHVVVNRSLTLLGEDRGTTVIDGERTSRKGTMITVTGDNVTISGFTIRNSREFMAPLYEDAGISIRGYAGVFLNYSSGHNVSGNTLTNNQRGIVLIHSNSSSVFGNTITSIVNNLALVHSTNNTIERNIMSRVGGDCVYSWGSYRNTFRDNSLISNKAGFVFKTYSSNNTFTGNTLLDNGLGVWLAFSDGNVFYRNNFINNSGWYGAQVNHSVSTNVWDAGYPVGGNFWSDYVGVDEYSGMYQNETGADGIGDSPYIVEMDGGDRYPLMNVWDEIPPTADAGVDQVVWVGDVVVLDASGSFDNVGVVSYSWDFGDGAYGTDVEASHVYAEKGVYDVVLTVEDAGGNSDSARVRITVRARFSGFIWWIVGVVVALAALVFAGYLVKVRKHGGKIQRGG